MTLYITALIFIGLFVAWSGGPRALILFLACVLAVVVRTFAASLGLNEWIAAIIGLIPLFIFWMCSNKWQIPKKFS